MLTKRVNQQSQAAGSSRIIDVGSMTKLVRHDLGHVGRRVKEVWKPSHECSNLDDTYPPDGFGQMQSGIVDCPNDVSELASCQQSSVSDHLRSSFPKDTLSSILLLCPAGDPNGHNEKNESDDTDYDVSSRGKQYPRFRN